MKISYANVVSTLAFFLVLAGSSAYAAHQLASKSVGARQLRPGAVTAEKLRKNAVTSPKIKPLAVTEGKIGAKAVTGGKLAVGSVTNEKLATGAVSGDKIAAGSISGAQIDEGSLSQVPNAAHADSATFAASADPAAFASIDQEGNADTSLSKEIASVRQGSEAGIYCVRVSSFSPRGAQVTVRYNGSGGATAYVTIGGTGSCPAPEVEVQTFSGGARVKEPFYVAFYR